MNLALRNIVLRPVICWAAIPGGYRDLSLPLPLTPPSGRGRRRRYSWVRRQLFARFAPERPPILDTLLVDVKVAPTSFWLPRCLTPFCRRLPLRPLAKRPPEARPGARRAILSSVLTSDPDDSAPSNAEFFEIISFGYPEPRRKRRNTCRPYGRRLAGGALRSVKTIEASIGNPVPAEYERFLRNFIRVA